MIIFNNTILAVSWCESLREFFQQKRDEYERRSIEANLLHNSLSAVVWASGFFFDRSPKEEEQINLSKARLKVEGEAYKYMSKFAHALSYVVKPLALSVLLPLAVLVDLGTFATNYIADIFKDEPAARNNTENINTTRARVNYDREVVNSKSPNMLNAYQNHNTNKSLNTRDNPRKGLKFKP